MPMKWTDDEDHPGGSCAVAIPAVLLRGALALIGIPIAYVAGLIGAWHDRRRQPRKPWMVVGRFPGRTW